MIKDKKNIIIINVVAILIFAVLLAADLLTKQWAVEVKPNYYLFNGFGLTIYYNSGMAFGMFDDNRTAMIAVIVITIAMMLVIAFAFVKVKSTNKFLKIILAIIEAGAIGNLVDRIMWLSGSLPGVRDFIDVSFFGFGVCNLADFYVTVCGVLLLIYFMFFGSDPLIPVLKKRREKKVGAEQTDGETTAERGE